MIDHKLFCICNLIHFQVKQLMQRLKKKRFDLSRFDCMVELVERERFEKGLVMLAENETHTEMY